MYFKIFLLFLIVLLLAGPLYASWSPSKVSTIALLRLTGGDKKKSQEIKKASPGCYCLGYRWRCIARNLIALSLCHCDGHDLWLKLYQDLGFALSFGNRTPCKRSIYLGTNRLERLEPEYNPTFWKLVNMLESELKIILMPILVLLKKYHPILVLLKKVSICSWGNPTQPTGKWSTC